MKTKFIGTFEFEVEYPEGWNLDLSHSKWIEEDVKDNLLDNRFYICRENKVDDVRRLKNVKVKVKKQ